MINALKTKKTLAVLLLNLFLGVSYAKAAAPEDSQMRSVPMPILDIQFLPNSNTITSFTFQHHDPVQNINHYDPAKSNTITALMLEPEQPKQPGFFARWCTFCCMKQAQPEPQPEISSEPMPMFNVQPDSINLMHYDPRKNIMIHPNQIMEPIEQEKSPVISPLDESGSGRNSLVETKLDA